MSELLSGDLIVVKQQKEAFLGGELLTVGQSITSLLKGDLTQIRRKKRAFNNNYHFLKNGINKENFSIALFIDNEEINPCDLLDKLEITMSENQNALAEFTLKQECGNIDYYQYVGKKVFIYVQNENGYYLLFNGIVNTPDFDFFTKSIKFTAINDKTDLIKNLEWNEINRIGFYSQKMFKDLETKEEIFNKRIESVAKSYFFNTENKLVVFDWQAKRNADILLTECDFMQNSFKFIGLKSQTLINKINLKFQFQYTRKMQRFCNMNYYGLGYGGTSNVDFYKFVGTYHFIPAPPVNSLVEAIKGAGWNVHSFYYTGLPPAIDGWSPSIYKDYYATSAMWSCSKRWLQNCQENFNITVRNLQSVELFGEKSEDINLSLRLDEKDEYKEWANEECYNSFPDGYLENGDYYEELNNSEIQEYYNAFFYAFQVAETKLYRNHRENYISGTIKFDKNLQLGQTILAETNNYKGKSVLTELKHTFDFAKRIATSEIKGQWVNYFYGENQGVSEEQAERPPLPLSYGGERYITFGNEIIQTYSSDLNNVQNNFNFCNNKEEDNKYGYILNEFIVNDIVQATVGRMSAIKLAIRTPEIEKTATDAVEAEKEMKFDLRINGETPELKLIC